MYIRINELCSLFKKKKKKVVKNSIFCNFKVSLSKCVNF